MSLVDNNTFADMRNLVVNTRPVAVVEYRLVEEAARKLAVVVEYTRVAVAEYKPDMVAQPDIDISVFVVPDMVEAEAEVEVEVLVDDNYYRNCCRDRSCDYYLTDNLIDDLNC